ncbi:MAG: MogA/MoaB family molybdenum cofactor biosynthesis protein [Desulfuromonadales bacterium]|nr:MogA/MoaB family molybdenum cofactor biosynthesis protein [Desulfuromonadales bacterium]
MIITAGIITVSDRGARGEREDLSGDEIARILLAMPVQIKARGIVPDEKDEIKALLREYADQRQLDLIITTGGTGLSPRDVTPEATREVIEREIPGLAETMRREGTTKTPFAALSRALAGTRGNSLIINLPGSPKAVREGLGVLTSLLVHAIEKIKGDERDCARTD